MFGVKAPRLITPAVFGGVEHTVGSGNKVFGGIFGTGGLPGEAHADGDVLIRAFGVFNLEQLDGIAQLARQRGQGFGVDVVPDDGKFLAAIAGDEIEGAVHELLQGGGDLMQHGIAGNVAVVVVIRLEVVDIDHRQREGFALALGLTPQAGKTLRELAAVGQFGERVGIGQHLPTLVAQKRMSGGLFQNVGAR